VTGRHDGAVKRTNDKPDGKPDGKSDGKPDGKADGKTDGRTDRKTVGKTNRKTAESDVQRRMREALEAKQARSKATHGEDHLGGRSLGPSTNDAHRREFRRKSG
jgi:hypothetical protein